VNFCVNSKYVIKQQNLNLRPKTTYMLAYNLQKCDLMCFQTIDFCGENASKNSDINISYIYIYMYLTYASTCS